MMFRFQQLIGSNFPLPPLADLTPRFGGKQFIRALTCCADSVTRFRHSRVSSRHSGHRTAEGGARLHAPGLRRIRTLRGDHRGFVLVWASTWHPCRECPTRSGRWGSAVAPGPTWPQPSRHEDVCCAEAEAILSTGAIFSPSRRRAGRLRSLRSSRCAGTYQAYSCAKKRSATAIIRSVIHSPGQGWPPA